jgi:hypothetical protein
MYFTATQEMQANEINELLKESNNIPRVQIMYSGTQCPDFNNAFFTFKMLSLYMCNVISITPTRKA